MKLNKQDYRLLNQNGGQGSLNRPKRETECELIKKRKQGIWVTQLCT